MKILIVEDDPSIAELVQRVLSDDGHDVASVGSGSAALTAALQNEYDLLICDLMLPDLQGTEIVRALKAQSPRLPVMVISALDGREWSKPCEDAGATRYLEKPLDLDDLRAEVRLVEKARLRLHIVIVDGDPIHSTRLTKVLTALGCEVTAFSDSATAQSAIEQGVSAGLLLIDADLAMSSELIAWGKARGTPAFAFSPSVDQDREDQLMRAGAAFLMAKPVDVDALLTQAAFMAG